MSCHNQPGRRARNIIIISPVESVARFGTCYDGGRRRRDLGGVARDASHVRRFPGADVRVGRRRTKRRRRVRSWRRARGRRRTSSYPGRT
jgi:hypothetical protein